MPPSEISTRRLKAVLLVPVTEIRRIAVALLALASWPKPLKVTEVAVVVPPSCVAEIVAPPPPSDTRALATIMGVTVADSATLHWPTGLTWLTTQDPEVADKVQLAPRSETN